MVVVEVVAEATLPRAIAAQFAPGTTAVLATVDALVGEDAGAGPVGARRAGAFTSTARQRPVSSRSNVRVSAMTPKSVLDKLARSPVCAGRVRERVSAPDHDRERVA